MYLWRRGTWFQCGNKNEATSKKGILFEVEITSEEVFQDLLKSSVFFGGCIFGLGDSNEEKVGRQQKEEVL